MTKVFFKAQISAFLGGIVDYSCMVTLTEFGGVLYPISICISGIVGAIVNFVLNKFWTFNAIEKKTIQQLKRFVAMVLISILLKSSGTYLFTTLFHLDYKITRLFVEIVVALGVNYPLQRYWVFANNKAVENKN